VYASDRGVAGGEVGVVVVVVDGDVVVVVAAALVSPTFDEEAEADIFFLLCVECANANPLLSCPRTT
jgi:hypothetical protein